LSHTRLRLLAVGLHLLALSHSSLRLLAIGLHLLTLSHARLSLLAIGTNLLAFGNTSLRLLTLSHTRLRLLAIGTNLLAFCDARLRLLHALLAHLLALGLHLHPFRALRTLDGRKLPLALDPRGCERLTFLARSGDAASHGRRSAATAAALSLGPLLSLLIAVATRSGGRRYRDRQSGDSCGQKYPGHHTISFRTAKRSARCTVPTPKRMEPAP
jgi:hypothetical protein